MCKKQKLKKRKIQEKWIQKKSEKRKQRLEENYFYFSFSRVPFLSKKKKEKKTNSAFDLKQGGDELETE